MKQNPVILLIGALVVGVMPYFWVRISDSYLPPVLQNTPPGLTTDKWEALKLERKGQLGDSFAPLAAFISSISVFLVIYSMKLQRDQNLEARASQSEDTRIQREIAEAMKDAAKLAALSARIEVLSQEIINISAAFHVDLSYTTSPADMEGTNMPKEIKIRICERHEMYAYLNEALREAGIHYTPINI